MDRTPGSSRIPALRSTALRGPSSGLRTPLASSTLGKRGAADAGFGDDPASARRGLASSQSRVSTLERQVRELERERHERDERIAQQQAEIDRLAGERRILHEGERAEKARYDEAESKWREEKAMYSSTINSLRTDSRRKKDDLEALKSQYDLAAANVVRIKREWKEEKGLLENRIVELGTERDTLKSWQSRAQALSIQIEDMKRREENNRERGVTEEEKKGDEVVRRELQHQAQNLVSLQRSNDALKAELSELRRWKIDSEKKEAKAKQVERTLRDEVQSLHEQLGRARREVDSLTLSFPSEPTEDASTLQSRLTTLSALHSEVTGKLAEQRKETDQLRSRLLSSTSESQGALRVLTKEKTELVRELRWAKEGRRNAEAREELVRKELEARSTRTEGTGGTADAAHVKHLEKLLDEYKSQLDGLARDSRDAEEQIAHGAGLVKLAELEAAKARVAELEKDIASLNATISELTDANTRLDAEVSELMRRVASGEFNPERERCLELRNNPASKIQHIRNAELEALKNENTALLDRLATVDRGGEDKQGLVPRQSYDRLEKEFRTAKEQHELRLKRLKDIFGAKSREFLEAVYSLLGWRFKFDENGLDVRLTSMYAPKGRMGLTLKFASHEGHFGTMQMSGALSRGLAEAHQFWVLERQSIPGFLAQVTTEMFEKTTIGRAAGYVGLGA